MFLVTGLDGLVSSSLIAVLLDSGQEFAVLTRRCQNPAQYPYPVIVADLLNPEETSARLSGLAFDAVFHAAAAMDGVADVQLDNAGNYLNAVMTKNLLAGLDAASVGTFVQTSSIDVYGPETFGRPVTEDSPLMPATDYGKSKLASETIVRRWSAASMRPALILRVTQMFGEKDRTGKFIPAVMKKIKAGLPVTVFGDGKDLRDYLYSHDAARLALNLCQKGCRGTFNLASGTSRSLRDMLEKIVLISGKTVDVNYQKRVGQRVDYRLDTDKLMSALPRFRFTDIDEALRKTYDHIL